MSQNDPVDDRRRANVIKRQLREHQRQVDDDKDDAIDSDSEALGRHFEQANSNLEKSRTVDQHLVDAQIFHKLGVYTKKAAEKLHTGLRTYDAKSIVDHLCVHMQRENARRNEALDDDELSMDVVRFGDSLFGMFRTMPGSDFMMGNEPKEAVPTAERKARSSRKTKGKAVKPSEIRKEDVQQTETDKQVAAMKRELQAREKCNFWEFVIDPNDFVRSVENVFHSAFLVKDSWAELDLKSDPPMIQYRDPDAQRTSGGEDGAEGIQKSQYIMEFDPAIWQENIRKYNISTCILPRPNSGGGDQATRRRGQWTDRPSTLASF